MSAEGWIFMVGFRLFDVGLLVAWLVWFFRLEQQSPDPLLPVTLLKNRRLPSASLGGLFCGAVLARRAARRWSSSP